MASHKGQSRVERVSLSQVRRIRPCELQSDWMIMSSQGKNVSIYRKGDSSGNERLITYTGIDQISISH